MCLCNRALLMTWGGAFMNGMFRVAPDSDVLSMFVLWSAFLLTTKVELRCFDSQF